jgi:hypothetical protein
MHAVPTPPPAAPPDIAAVAQEPTALPESGEGPLRAPRLVYKRASGDDGPRQGAPLFDDAADDESGDHDAFAPQESEVIQWPGKKHRPLPADDDFFEALRSALDDDAPLGPREDAPLPVEPDDSGSEQAAPPEGRSGSRFRRRR